MDSEGELSLYFCLVDILRKFQSVSGSNFKLKKEQDTTMESLPSTVELRRTWHFADWQKFATCVLQFLH